MTAIPKEMLGLRVEVVRSIRRTAGLHIVGTDLQVRVPEHLGDERVAAKNPLVAFAFHGAQSQRLSAGASLTLDHQLTFTTP